MLLFLLLFLFFCNAGANDIMAFLFEDLHKVDEVLHTYHHSCVYFVDDARYVGRLITTLGGEHMEEMD